MAVKKEKKTGKDKSKKKHNRQNKKGGKKKNAPKRKSILLKIIKWFFVIGLWGILALAVLTAWYARDLPEITSSPRFEHRTAITVKAADGSTISRYGELKGMAVPLEDLPSELIYAVMAIEDRRFYEHAGMDPLGIARAAVINLMHGDVVQGGSTITQQLAKNLFLSHERTLRRKIQEALLAFWLENELTKDEILTAYLNRVYFGSGAYGVEAAANTYFNKSARDLNLQESAMLAGLLKAPSRYSPLNNHDLARKRMRIVLSAMRNAGYITDNALGKNSKFAVPEQAAEKRKETTTSRYFTDYVLDQLDDLIGPPSEDLIVETTLMPDIQKAAETSLADTLDNLDEEYNVQEGAVLVMHKDGAILAMVGGRNYSKSQFNRATQAHRPPGSAFKALVFLAALEEGYKSTDKINDAPITEGEYRPSNFKDKYFGEVTLQEALGRSLNSASVRLMQDVGIGKVIDLARTLGIEAPLNRDLSLALGSSGLPMLEMVEAYGVMANNGKKVEPFVITKITDREDNLYYERNRKNAGSQVIDIHNASELTFMLTNAVDRGTGKNARLKGRPAAGKTGTSQDHRDAWFIGYTGDYIAAVWVGNDDKSPMINITGGGLPAQIWKEVMMAAHKTAPPENLFFDSKSGFGSLLDKLLGGVSPTETRGYND